MVGIKLLPGIELDKAYALQNLRGHTDTLVGDPHTFLALSKHDIDEEKLDGKSEDQDS